MIFLIFRTIFDKIKAVTGDSYPASRAKSVVHRRFLRTRAKRIRRFVVLPLSALFCRFFLFFAFFFKRSFRNSLPTQKIGAEKHAVLPSFAVLAAFSVFFVPDWKQPNVSCETFGCFLLSSSLFLLTLLSFVSPFVFHFFLPCGSARCFFSSFCASIGVVFTSFRFSGDFWACYS